jgi:hypothetical protein
MNLRLGRLLPFLFLACSGEAQVPTSSAKQWELTLWTPEGYHSMTLRGDEVRPLSKEAIQVLDLNIEVFSGDASNRIVTILLSPDAVFYPDEQRAAGPKAVRLIRDDAEITGEDWSFQRAGEKVSIGRNVKVIFKASVSDFLK